MDRRTEATARRILRETGGKARTVRFFDSPMEIHHYVVDTIQRREKERWPVAASRRLPDPLRKAAIPLFLQTLASPPAPAARSFREAFQQFWRRRPLGVFVLREMAPRHRGMEFTEEHVLMAKNQEVRRVFLERLGMDRFLQELAADKVGVDDYGILYRVSDAQKYDPPFFDIEELRFVKVCNSTPEPGTQDVFKEYLLQVPAEIRTPREGVAWSFGLSEQDYSPLQET